MVVYLTKHANKMEEEIWKDVEGFEGKYFISNHGRFKSVNGKFSKKCPDGYITLGTIDSLNYRVLTLRDHGRIRRERAHRLVAIAFIQKVEGKKFVNHIDGNGLNNHVSNLEWCTHKENLNHAMRIGLMDNKGEKHGMSKLNSEQVREIRRLRKEENLTHQKIADKFKVNRRHIGEILNGINWGWLT